MARPFEKFDKKLTAGGGARAGRTGLANPVGGGQKDRPKPAPGSRIQAAKRLKFQEKGLSPKRVEKRMARVQERQAGRQEGRQEKRKDVRNQAMAKVQEKHGKQGKFGDMISKLKDQKGQVGNENLQKDVKYKAPAIIGNPKRRPQPTDPKPAINKKSMLNPKRGNADGGGMNRFSNRRKTGFGRS